MTTLTRNKWLVIATVGLTAVAIVFFFWNKKALKLAISTAESKNISQQPPASLITSDANQLPFEILSESSTSTGTVYLVTKNGMTNTAIMPNTMHLTPEQLEQVAFPSPSQISPQSRPAKMKLNEELIFYGMALDEKSNAVMGAKVEGNVLVMRPNENQIREITTTSSGTDGSFNLQVPWGQQMMVTVTAGTNYVSPPPQWFQYGPVGNQPIYQPDPNNPAIFVLTKKQPVDSIVEISRWFYAPNTGEPVHVDLATGKNVPDGGDLVVSIYCPEPYTEMKRFPWKLNVQAVEGGLIRVDEQQLEYMHEAPADGYQDGFASEYGPSIEPWRVQYEGVYYLTSRTGHFFGKMRFRMNTRWDERGVPFYIHAFVNTSGTRNLQSISD